MKKSDIAMIVLIASFSVVIAFVVANQLPFLKPPAKGESVKTTEKISAEVGKPDTKVFNGNAINPTVQTVIGGTSSGN
jgi:hypothetical protein